MLGKLISNKFSRVIAKFENAGNVFKANKSSGKVTVFTKEKMSFINDLNEQNTNNLNASVSPIYILIFL